MFRQEWKPLASLLQLNLVSVVHITKLFLEPMLAQAPRPCYILNVSSVAAFQPSPGFAVYGASKSFVKDFSCALRFELRNSNVSVSTLCPGIPVPISRIDV